MCPRTAFHNNWQNEDMTWHTFENLSRSFTRFNTIYLSGWGEPLIHPRIWDMVALAKKARKKVGFTTNGLLLNGTNLEKVLGLIDIIGISIDGASTETYGQIRPGSVFKEVIENVRQLIQLKQKRRQSKPKVSIVFMKMKLNISELISIIKLGAELGVNKVVATNLDYLAKPRDDSLRIFSEGEVAEEYQNIVRQARETAKRLSITFRDYPLAPRNDVVNCEASPLETLFVSWQGNYSPCVYLCLPINGKFKRIFYGKEYNCDNLSFGNVNQMSLAELWRDTKYQTFRGQFIKRKKAFEKYSSRFGYSVYHAYPESNSGSELRFDDTTSIRTAAEWLDRVEPQASREVENQIARISKEFPFPDECQTCYKRLGL